MQRTTPHSARTGTPPATPLAVKLALGLGNPGAEYAHTYHNAGALFIAHLARAYPPTKAVSRPLFSAERTAVGLLAHSEVFMNESGRAARAALAYFRLSPDALLVAHDDSDIPLGEFRLVFGRGAAGHNGVASTIAAIGTKEFWRLRIGIRHRAGKAGSFVLRRITPEHMKKLHSVFVAASEKLTWNVTP